MSTYRYDTTVPESYWPQPNKPWRLSWGFGAFKDFATLEEAQAEHERLLTALTGDWVNSVWDPYNAVEKWAPMRIKDNEGRDSATRSHEDAQ